MKGFILNGETYLERFQDQYDETQLYGLLEDGRNFIWKQSPAFLKAFIPEKSELGEKYYYHQAAEGFSNYNGEKLTTYLFPSLNKLKEAKRSLPGVEFLESELGSIPHLLIQKKIRGSLEFLSSPVHESSSTVIYQNPKVCSADFMPQLTCVSIDIETGVDDGLLYSIALYGAHIRKVLMLDPKQELQTTSDAALQLVSLPTEKALLHEFLKEMHLLNPQIIMGWNVVGFDFNYLLRKYEDYQIPFTLGIHHEKVISYKRKTRDIIIKIPGRAFLEGMELTKALGDPLPNYKLDTAAEVFLGEKKTISLTGLEKIKEINHLFATDKHSLAVYNLKDAELVYTLMNKFEAVPFQLKRSLLTGVLMERLKSHSEITLHTLLPLLRQKRIATTSIVLETLTPPQEEEAVEPTLIPKTGPVSLLTFENLIPLTILLYKIDPYGMLAAKHNSEDPEQSLHTPTGFAFHPQHHFLPFLVEKNLQLLSEVPHERPLDTAVLKKTLSQTLEGLTAPQSRFAFPNLYKAIRETAFHLIKKLASAFTEAGAEVLYFDTFLLLLKKKDLSLDFSTSKTEEKKIFKAHNEFLAHLLTDIAKKALPELLTKTQHTLNLEMSQSFKKIFIPEQIPTSLKEKREKSSLTYYALDTDEQYIRHSREHHRLKLLTKIEAELISAYLKEQDMQVTVERLKQNLSAGEYDDLLIYKKKLTKPLDSFDKTGTLPPHIEAALKIPDLEDKEPLSTRRPTIYYVVTQAGGEPAGNLSKPIRYDHYWTKEVEPFIQKLFKRTPIETQLQTVTRSEDHELSLF